MADFSIVNEIPKMTSNTTPSGQVLFSSELSPNNSAWKAFDQIESSFWNNASSGLPTGQIGYRFPNPIIIYKYSIRNVSATSSSPRAWTFEGSNDGVNWTVLDTKNDIAWTVIERREYTIPSSNQNLYIMYRLNITATTNSNLAISEIEMFKVTYSHKILLSSNDKTYSIAPPIYATETAVPKMTSNTTPSGRAFSSSIYGSGYEPWKAFDGTANHYSSGTNTANGGNIGYEFQYQRKIGKYALSTMALTYGVKDWTFEGSNDGVSWTILDTQVNQSWTISYADKDFFIDVNKVKEYKMYRLNWTANGGGGNYVTIAELKMFEVSSLKLINIPNQSEQTFLNHGMESPINITQLDGIKSIESNSTTHESGKIYTYTIDLSKRRVDKIILS